MVMTMRMALEMKKRWRAEDPGPMQRGKEQLYGTKVEMEMSQRKRRRMVRMEKNHEGKVSD